MMITIAVAIVPALLLATSADDVELWRASPHHARAVLAPRDGDVATLRVIFRTGAADDGLEYGKTRLAQLTLLQGAVDWAAFDDDLYAAGGTIALTTGVRDCAFEMTARAPAFARLAPRLLKMLLAPPAKPRPDGFAYAQRLALTDQLGAGSDAELYAFVASNVLLTQGVGEGGGDYNNPLWGERETLKEMTADVIAEHIHKKLAPANATVIVAGHFDGGALKKALRAYAGGTERALQRASLGSYLPLTLAHDAPRELHMHLQLVEANDAASLATVHVLAAVVEERLFWKLRRTGHVYTPAVIPAFEEWLDFILVMFTVAPGHTLDVSPALRQELDRIADGGITDDERQRAQAVARARLQALDDDSAALARALDPASRGIVTVGGGVLDAIDTVDLASLQRAAARSLAKDRSISVTFGPNARGGGQ